MTQMLDPVNRKTFRDETGRGAMQQHQPERSTGHRGLSDHQVIIVGMIANGATCQDVAFELLLPLRTVQGHLHLALHTLGLSGVEDLTHAVIAAHQARTLATAIARFKGLKPTEPTEPTESTADGWSSRSTTILDAIEASDPRDVEPGQFARLASELAAMRAELDEQHRKVQQLHQAVDSRDSIGQAKGILMERHRISAAAAFRSLQEESDRSNRKLIDVARAFISSNGESIETQGTGRSHERKGSSRS